jgi:tetratricopeptide (TPR) repeat protein
MVVKGQFGTIQAMTLKSRRNAVDRRLTTWKEIGAFFDRDERTVKRWEASRGLPVRRVPGKGRGSVFAYESELVAWLNGGGPAEAVAAPDAAPAESSDPERPADAPISLPRTPPPPLSPPTAARDTRDGRKIGAAVVGFVGAACLGLAVVAIHGGWPAGAWGTVMPARRLAAPDAAAVALYRAGTHSWQMRTPEGLTRAVADFNQAILRDPDYAEAYMGLANCYNLLREFTMMPPEQAYPKAKAAAARAIALDPSLAGAHASLAFVEFYWSRDVAGARREFQRAIELDPSNPVAHHWFATFLMTLGEYDAALAEIDKAEALDSESKAILADKGLVLFYAGRPDAAIDLLKQLEGEDAAFVSPHRYLANIYGAAGDDEDYLRELHQSAALLKDDAGLQIVAAGWAGLHAGGRIDMRRSMLEQERALYAQGKVSAYQLADRLASLDDTEGALACLETSLQRNEADTIALLIDPNLKALRDAGRLRALIARAGLPVGP